MMDQKMEDDKEIWERENENFFFIITIINCFQKMGEHQETIGKDNELLCFS